MQMMKLLSRVCSQVAKLCFLAIISIFLLSNMTTGHQTFLIYSVYLCFPIAGLAYILAVKANHFQQRYEYLHAQNSRTPKFVHGMPLKVHRSSTAAPEEEINTKVDIMVQHRQNAA